MKFLYSLFIASQLLLFSVTFFWTKGGQASHFKLLLGLYLKEKSLFFFFFEIIIFLLLFLNSLSFKFIIQLILIPYLFSSGISCFIAAKPLPFLLSMAMEAVYRRSSIKTMFLKISERPVSESLFQ